ncbi:MAG: type II toxin-antitoxin system HicB family antitoxin [Armatimonadetes bacterium]|nr:type II toxin-antitoxin system HicB family antitoxin [Armatimonadota bacterium]
MTRVRFVVEQHPEGYVAYPLGVEGAVVGEGDTAEETLADCRSALLFHVEAFGPEVLRSAGPILGAFVMDAEAA